MELTPQGAAAELIKRRQVRLSLAEWARFKGFDPAQHHLLIINEIETFLESDDEVLLLFAPPGSAKSTYVSVLLPSWYLATHPTHSILAATHAVEFAERWGRRVRNDIASDGNLLGIFQCPVKTEGQAHSDEYAVARGRRCRPRARAN
jgi:hypothetical protein